MSGKANMYRYFIFDSDLAVCMSLKGDKFEGFYGPLEKEFTDIGKSKKGYSHIITTTNSSLVKRGGIAGLKRRRVASVSLGSELNFNCGGARYEWSKLPTLFQIPLLSRPEGFMEIYRDVEKKKGKTALGERGKGLIMEFDKNDVFVTPIDTYANQMIAEFLNRFLENGIRLDQYLLGDTTVFIDKIYDKI